MSTVETASVKEKNADRDRHRQIIRDGLERSFSDNAAVSKIDGTAGERMVDIITDTTLGVGGMLKLPQIRYSIASSGKVMKGFEARAGLVRPEYNTTGRIVGSVMFNPDCLIGTAEDFRKPIIGEWCEDRLRSTVAHELYHIHEAIVFPNRYCRSVNQVNNIPVSIQLNAWSSDWGEYAAELFALKYIKLRRIEGWTEKIGHELNILEMKYILGEMKRMRRGK